MSVEPTLEDEQGDELSGAATLEADVDEVELYTAAAASTPPEWWEHAYAGGPPVGPAKLIRPLYFPGNPAGRPASEPGPDVLAVKRAVWRGGRWPGPASRFDDVFSVAFARGTGGNVVETGLAGFQRQMRLEASGQMGDKTYQALRYARVPETFPHAGEPLFDPYSIDLLAEASRPAPADPDDVRVAIADYCRRCIAEAPAWHYQQYRAMRTLGIKPEHGGTSDCSEHATAAYYWAMLETGITVPDPNHRGYDGYGYTGTLVENPETGSPYKVGDLALYGPSRSSTSHVCTCYVPGDASSSRWCSHGSEDAPFSVSLHYRSDLLLVVRPALVVA
jgi:hypothetical protein